jgi:hypothetical protein
MAKIFDFDARKWSLLDQVSKTAGTLTVGSGGFVQTEKGMAMQFDESATNINYGDILGITSSFSAVAWVKTDVISQIIFARDGSAGNRGFYLSTSVAGNFRLFVSPNGSTTAYRTATGVISDGHWHCCIGIYDASAQTIRLFIDNIEDTGTLTGTVPSSINVSTVDFIVGISSGGAVPFGGDIARAMVYNHAITIQERAKIYNDFLHASPLAKPKRNYYFPRPTSSNESGLVAHYVFSPETIQGGQLLDISGEGNDGTINGALQTKDGMSFDGVNDYVNCGDMTNLDGATKVTVACRVYTNSNHNGSIIAKIIATDRCFALFCGSGSSYPYISLKAWDGSASNVDYVDVRSDSDQLQVSQWVNVVAHLDLTTNSNSYIYINGDEVATTVTTDGTPPTSIQNTASNLEIGRFWGGIYQFDGKIDDVKVYNHAWTASQAQAYHNQWVRPYLIDDFSDSPTDGTTIVPEGWVSGTGSYKIEEVNYEI